MAWHPSSPSMDQVDRSINAEREGTPGSFKIFPMARTTFHFQDLRLRWLVLLDSGNPRDDRSRSDFADFSHRDLMPGISGDKGPYPSIANPSGEKLTVTDH